jgi:hypothetical protein
MLIKLKYKNWFKLWFGCDTDDDRFATLVHGQKFYFIDLNSSTSFK